MMLLSFLIAIGACGVAFLSALGITDATAGVWGMALACFLGIVARLLQSAAQHAEAMKRHTMHAPAPKPDAVSA